MSASSGRDPILTGELQSDLDGKGKKIRNVDLTDTNNVFPSSAAVTIAHTTGVLKGDNFGNAVAATAKSDFWNTDTFGASGPSHDKGLVPDPGGSASSDNFLCEDGTWSVPTGAQTVPTIANSGILKGNGSGSAVAATAGTDYWATTAVTNGVNHTKGLAPDPGSGTGTTKFLREDGSWQVPPASAGVTIESTSNVIKGDGAGGGVAATPGTDYVAPSTALTRLLAGTTALSGATPTVNWQTTTSFSHTLSGNTTYSFSNVTDGWNISIVITNTASNYTVTWPAGIVWVGGTAPTMTTGAKTDFYGFDRKGSITYGAVLQNMS